MNFRLEILAERKPMISSLNEAWLHILDSCVADFPLSDVIPPLMRNYFVAGATHAVLLLQRGHGDQLLRDIAGFSNEASPSVSLEPLNTPWRAHC
jgi:hypothetical protein